MTVWRVAQDVGKLQSALFFFVCAPCAIDFYNADRARRAAPVDVLPPDDEGLVNPCKCDQPQGVAA